MVLITQAAPAPAGKRQKANGAPAMARAAAATAAGASAAPAAAWGATAPRTIRTRMMARTARPAQRGEAACAGVVGQYLGGGAPAAARPAGGAAAAPARGAGAPPDSPTLYMDGEGRVHLGVRPGDDKALFDDVRRLQAEEQQAAARAIERRAPAMAAQRRAAAAASGRAPRVVRAAPKRSAKHRATRDVFQPRRQN
ncbi:hypothetical protein Rsub_00223 [Raphidocelis subcapitata]|uniref:Uncharacterized protein n=1 Tax=Raphidocelis subcapitata TaxID=307507 RepID=A0A2V0NM96_9CHLO|nr:hypothetical protein Rsub_00223 [Raphidocelis subcapitata]|eukprot:GBF87512.1 hypothetical protein Rsub_00223 [Raphidocelis subcapitata]